MYAGYSGRGSILSEGNLLKLKDEEIEREVKDID